MRFILILSTIFLLFARNAFAITRSAEAAPAPAFRGNAVAACYGYDDTVQKGCEALRNKLANCKINVTWYESLTPAEIEASPLRFRKGTPTFIVGHGADLFGGGHAIGILMKAEQFNYITRFFNSVDGIHKLIPTEDIETALAHKMTLPQENPAFDEAKAHADPPTLVMGCYAGAHKVKGRATSAAVSTDKEMNYFNVTNGIDFPSNKITDLMCSDNDFAKADEKGNRNGLLDTGEIRDSMCAEAQTDLQWVRRDYLTAPIQKLMNWPDSKVVADEGEMRKVIDDLKKDYGDDNVKVEEIAVGKGRFYHFTTRGLVYAYASPELQKVMNWADSQILKTPADVVAMRKEISRINGGTEVALEETEHGPGKIFYVNVLEKQPAYRWQQSENVYVNVNGYNVLRTQTVTRCQRPQLGNFYLLPPKDTLVPTEKK